MTAAAPLEQHLDQLLRCFFLHVRQDVAVGVQREGDAGVPQALGHHLGMHARLQEQRLVGMPQAVEVVRDPRMRL